MCTRFFIEIGSDELTEIVEAARQSALAERFVKAGSPVYTSGEIRPTNVTAVIAPDKAGHRKVYPMKWGFQIPGRSLLVNARVETAAEKPTFKEAWKSHRFVIPASWYYEWMHDPTPVYPILTREPTARLREIHDRMPLILPKDAIGDWINPSTRPEDLLPYAVTDMVLEKAR